MSRGCRMTGLTTFVLGVRSRTAGARWWLASRRGVGLAVAILVAAYAGAAPMEASAKGQLDYHGGPVLTHSTKTYVIYWQGPGGTLPNNYLPDLAQFIQDWSGSGSHRVLTQYYQDARRREHVANTLGVGGVLTATDSFPKTVLTDDQIQHEVRQFVIARRLPEGYRVNYAIALPQQEQTETRCAWHDWAPDRQTGGKIFYAVIPYYSHSSDCPMPGGPYPHGEDIDNAIDLLSHELSEIATNPWHSHADGHTSRSWYTSAKKLSDQQEIGDLCRTHGHGVYGPRDPRTGADVLLNGHPYLIQGEWSNAENRCSLGPTAALLQTYISDLAQFSNPQYGATVRPRNIKFYTGAYLERLRWRSWGYPVAHATGAVNIVDKSHTPYTAHYYPVTVRATARRRCGSLLFYTRLHVHFTHRKPHELARNSTFVMDCSI